MQMAAGRDFLHDHPNSAKSWDMPEVADMVAHAHVSGLDAQSLLADCICVVDCRASLSDHCECELSLRALALGVLVHGECQRQLVLDVAVSHAHVSRPKKNDKFYQQKCVVM